MINLERGSKYIESQYSNIYDPEKNNALFSNEDKKSLFNVKNHSPRSRCSGK